MSVLLLYISEVAT